jgi:hypothetical protein
LGSTTTPVTHDARFLGSTGPEQHSPLDVTFAIGQQAPSPAGILPETQHCGPCGMLTFGEHSLLLGPLGASPRRQQTPVEVIWLPRQQDLPLDT